MIHSSVLVVDDDRRFREFVIEELGRERIEAMGAESVARALALLGEHNFDVVLTDLNMPQLSGLELCSRLQERAPETPVILLTAFGSLDTAISAMRLGAFDYITKPFDTEELVVRIERAAKTRRLRAELRDARESRAAQDALVRLQGDSKALRDLRGLVAKIAPIDMNVLVTGESGTGKELVARELHDGSPRRRGPFVAVNCAALPESLIESELFGVERGAFTDARASRPGLFVQATGGTLFLDEVGELPPAVQPKLLRAIQEQSVRPVGSTHEQATNVRLVAATNRDLESLVEQGRFRADFFHRLNVIALQVPPLRVREGDVLILAHTFLRDASKRLGLSCSSLSPAAAQRLLEYDWPGNVRELKNCVERAAALTRYEEITVEDLPAAVRDFKQKNEAVVRAAEPHAVLELAEVERRYILQAYELFRQNKTLTAKALGLDRKTLRSKLRSYGLDADD